MMKLFRERIYIPATTGTGIEKDVKKKTQKKQGKDTYSTTLYFSKVKSCSLNIKKFAKFNLQF